jgi:hypothetical protein
MRRTLGRTDTPTDLFAAVLVIARHWDVRLALPVLVAAALVAGSCGGGTATREPSGQDLGTAAGSATTPAHSTTKEDTTVTSAPDTTSSSPTDSSGLFFPTQEPTEGPRAVMEALTSGKLVVEKGCLLLSHEDGSTDLPVWPPGFELSTKGGEIRVLDEAGRVVARVGDQVRMGGGQVAVSERLRRRLSMPEECPGPIWWVGEGVRAIHRG